ncbi:MAG: hypothetical protein EXQ95_14250 [Alphaproteobacteria bacterium]|nr:hypothetical protein [Alphaproteobacteria bacterium]
MSMPYSIIYCDECVYRGASFVTWGLFKYRFDDGHESYMDRVLGWCVDCDGVRAIEDLPDPAILEGDLGAVRNRLTELDGNGVLSWLASALSRKRKEEIRELREREADLTHLNATIAKRKAHARCLDCGSERTAPIPVIPREGKRYVSTPERKCIGAPEQKCIGDERGKVL